MLVIGIQNTKGGATKSTTSVNLARAFQLMGYSVGLGETDPQGTLREWYADNQTQPNDQPKVIQLLERDAILSIRESSETAGLDILIVDGAANGFAPFISLTKVADFIVVVAQPTPADVKPLGELVDILESKEVPAAFLLTRAKKGVALVDQIRSLLGQFPFPVMNSTIRDLVGFQTSFGVGHTVFEYRDYKAGQEDMNAVANEIIELLKANAEG